MSDPLNLDDESNSTDVLKIMVTPGPDKTRRSYRVTDASVRKAVHYVTVDKEGREEILESYNGSEGVFKNGTLYKPGEIVKLDEDTAAAFIELGEVEEAFDEDDDEEAS